MPDRIEELVAAIDANTLLQWDGRDVALEAAHELATIARRAERERDWLASDAYIATCPPNAPLHKPLVWSADGMTVEDGGCGGDAERCMRCRITAAREAVRE
jgi:hypothetical protein